MSLRISVVVPTFNRADLLVCCVRSLLSQDFPSNSYEILVVDDGSTDCTTDAVAELRESTSVSLALVQQKKHLGPAAARNRGILEARAPIVAFTDSDVRVHDTWLSAIMAALAKAPLAVGVEGRTIAADQHKSVMREVLQNEFGGLYLTCNVAYRRDSLLRVGGFDERFTRPWCEDTDLALRIRVLGPIVFEPHMLCVHPARPVSARSLLRLPNQTVAGSLLLTSKHPAALATHRVRNYTYAAYLAAAAAIPIAAVGHQDGLTQGSTAVAALLFARIVNRTLRFRSGLRRQWLSNALACAILPALHYCAVFGAFVRYSSLRRAEPRYMGTGTNISS